MPIKAHESYSLFAGTQKPSEQYSHEDYSVEIIKTLLGDVIEQHPSNRRNYKITAQEVTALISKGAPGGASLFWKDIISGQLDADRMDYLLRDSLHAGVSYGKFDLDRIVSSVCVIRRPAEESEEPKIAIMRGGVFAAEALIVARYWMHKQVYFHKTRLACNYHLEKAMRAILKEQQKFATENVYYPGPDSKEHLEQFLSWDDYKVMGLLASGQGGEHGERLMTRNHYRLVCELEESDETLTELSASMKRNDAIVDMLGPLVKHVDQPKTLWYKAKAASDELVLVDDEGREQIGFFSRYSALMKSINFGSIRFVYADKPDAKAARKKYREYLQNESRSANQPKDDVPSEQKEVSEAASIIPPAEQTTKSAQLTLETHRPSGKSVQQGSAPKKGVQDAI